MFAGTDLNEGQAFKFDLCLYLNDDLKASKNAKVDILVDNLTVEQCSDVIVSITHLVPDFKTVLRYDDLSIKPIGMDLEKRVRYQTPLFYLKKELIKSGNFSDEALGRTIDDLLHKKRQATLGTLHNKNKKQNEALEKTQLVI